MTIGDKVIYSEKHYKWLVSAGLWPGPLTREAIIGSVISYGMGLVQVEWEKNWIYKVPFGRRWHLRDQEIYTHFLDNLEVLVS